MKFKSLSLNVGKFYKTNTPYFTKAPSEGVINSQSTTNKTIMYLGIHEYSLGWSEVGKCLKFLMDGEQIIYFYIPLSVERFFHEAKTL